MALGNSRFASMSSGLLLVRILRFLFGVLSRECLANMFLPVSHAQDPLPSPSADHPTNGKPYTPFPSPDHHVQHDSIDSTNTLHDRGICARISNLVLM